MQLIHIAPELPPTVGGVADYTAILTRQIVELSDQEIEPVLVHAGARAADKIEVSFPVVDVSGRCSASALASTIKQLATEASTPSVVLMEYSGYGYADRGTPAWLIRGLQRGCQDAGIALVTVFHELYATSWKPWERSFWTMPVQWGLAFALARLSHGIMTNRSNALRWLRRHARKSPLCMCPTFSNVGEPKQVRAYDDRGPFAVLFGGKAMKRRLFDQHSGAIESMLTEFGAERVLDIGPSASLADFSFGLPIEEKGILPAAEISGHLRNASIGLLHHSLHCLTKSGIWASYAAHGIPPLVAGNGHASEGLMDGQHYLRLEREHRRGNAGNHLLPSIARNVREWYETKAHSSRAARHLLDLLTYVLQNYKGVEEITCKRLTGKS